jgi:hypothetical protein
MKNQSHNNKNDWIENNMKFREQIRQEYNDCSFSAGKVEGHPADTMFLRIMRNNGDDRVLLILRPDEMAAIAWCACGVMFEKELDDKLLQSQDINCFMAICTEVKP